MALSIRVDEGRHVRADDFGVAVQNDQLLVPAELAQILRRANVRTVNQLVSVLRSFPGLFMAEFDWDQSRFEQARADVFEHLKGHVNPKILAERPRVRRGMGALPPRKRAGETG